MRKGRGEKMLLLSFVGTGEYKEVTYVLQDGSKECKTKFFVQAANEFYNPSKIIIFMTKAAEEKYHSELQSILDYKLERIQEGKTIQELWNNFDTISSAIPNDEEIIIDITHAFRSIPIVTLSVLTFLKTLNDIKINKIIYGAYEAKEFYNGKAPVFDLTNFLYLIEWSYATEEFLKFGNAKRLRKLLEDIHNTTYKTNADTKSIALKSLGKTIDELTRALSVVRPMEVLSHVKELQGKIEKAKVDINNLVEVRPLAKLLEKLPSNFRVMSEAKGDLFSNAGFQAQIEMLNFYIEIENYQQAITLARELIVSLLCSQRKLNPLAKEDREKAENMLNEWKSLSEKGLALLDSPKQYAQLWSKIVEYRNDINHAGMRKDPIAAQSLISNIIDLCKEISKFVVYNDDINNQSITASL
ncbi:MAG: TIGR02221 family CRISPR-associated protein [Candidatus Aenigmatarchaeota archaeon]